MVVEIPESGESVFQSYNASEENTSEIWNGREVRIANSLKSCKFDQTKISSLSLDGQENSLIAQSISSASLPPRGWNHESFPTPPTKPILTPVPDGNTCLYYARSFKTHLLKWMHDSFVKKDLMDECDYDQIEGILQMLVDEVQNYVSMAGLYSTNVDWKGVLYPLNRLFQFWNYKWKNYNVPPSPYDYPLP
ncbi:MAG: hypothetical protein KDK96_09660 [Chlamydiia bacterium]|nr:hypothetical protein [Simkania sp.]MCB1073349.1 hypothetical protein [Chlamydiia bacterium]MCP5491401.1 hypothetical protein [Chlamydiales bacterium]